MRRAVVAMVGIAALAMMGTVPKASPPEAAGAVPVLVELFTAEGCSSCPPADKLLELMIASQPTAGVQIIGVGEHVDYWDKSGWKDRFSSAAFTARQQAYADRMKLESIYTPQFVVDGADAMVGTEVDAARQAIERARTRPHGTIALSIDRSASSALALSIDVSALPPIESGDRADLVVVVTEDHLQTDVKKGENRGRVLSHAAVARQWISVAEVTSPNQSAKTEIKLKPEWKREHLAVVAFVQERASRRVLAVARRGVDVV